MQRSVNLVPGAPVEHLRASAGVRVERSSLRRVAREIGMSPSGLKKFLRGASPYTPTLRRLQRWYVQHATADGGDLGYSDASAALAVLTHDLGADALPHTVTQLVECLGDGYEASGRPRPPWLEQLRGVLVQRP